MPDHDQSAPADQPESTPVVTPPTIDPTRWEDFEGFRETLLLYFPRPDANAALRTVATLLYDLVLDSGTVLMPDHPEGWARAQVRAALADLPTDQTEGSRSLASPWSSWPAAGS